MSGDIALQMEAGDVQSKMPSVDKLHYRLRVVTLESLCARRDEDLIVLAPNGEGRRLVLAEILVELGIVREIGLVVGQVLELNLAVSGAIHGVEVQIVCLRRDFSSVRGTFLILHRAREQEASRQSNI